MKKELRLEFISQITCNIMTVKQFIEKAIEGGYLKDKETNVNLAVTYISIRFLCYHDTVSITWIDNDSKDKKKQTTQHSLESFVLDLTFWQAVGKTERWDFGYSEKFKSPSVTRHIRRGKMIPSWKENMHRMIDTLAEDKSLESFIKTL